MSAFVVDVNVPIVANGSAAQADLGCQSACVDALLEIVVSGTIVLDDEMLILDQYLRYLNPGGQPSAGDAFMQWVWENQAVSDRCEQVHLNHHCEVGFKEFPNDPRLDEFDYADRVYVAVAMASHNSPEILNAVDSDWWNHREALGENGARIVFLCPQHMRT